MGIGDRVRTATVALGARHQLDCCGVLRVPRRPEDGQSRVFQHVLHRTVWPDDEDRMRGCAGVSSRGGGMVAAAYRYQIGHFGHRLVDLFAAAADQPGEQQCREGDGIPGLNLHR
jgi:hypothetical protein